MPDRRQVLTKLLLALLTPSAARATALPVVETVVAGGIYTIPPVSIADLEAMLRTQAELVVLLSPSATGHQGGAIHDLIRVVERITSSEDAADPNRINAKQIQEFMAGRAAADNSGRTAYDAVTAIGDVLNQILVTNLSLDALRTNPQMVGIALEVLNRFSQFEGHSGAHPKVVEVDAVMDVAERMTLLFGEKLAASELQVEIEKHRKAWMLKHVKWAFENLQLSYNTGKTMGLPSDTGFNNQVCTALKDDPAWSCIEQMLKVIRADHSVRLTDETIANASRRYDNDGTVASDFSTVGDKILSSSPYVLQADESFVGEDDAAKGEKSEGSTTHLLDIAHSHASVQNGVTTRAPTVLVEPTRDGTMQLGGDAYEATVPVTNLA